MVGLFSLNGNGIDTDNITIRLFENEPVDSVKLDSDAYTYTIVNQNNQRTQLDGNNTPIQVTTDGAHVVLETSDTTFTNVSVRIIVDKDDLISIDHPELYERHYPGELYFSANESGLKILNTTDFETYISGVVGAEMNFEEHQALKAQAVIARTYARRLMDQQPSEQKYDLVDHTMNQVYRGVIPDNPDFEDATNATTGEVLTYEQELILAVYSSTCGGATSSNKGYWDGRDLPYLTRVADGGACQNSPHFQWRFAIERDELYRKLGNYLGYELLSIETGEEDGSGRWKNMYLHVAEKDFPLKISGVNFRQHVNAVFGIYALRSMRFTLDRLPNQLIFSGKGMGHGIGLCQWGAKGLGEAGWNYKEILKFYYQEVEISKHHSL